MFLSGSLPSSLGLDVLLEQRLVMQLRTRFAAPDGALLNPRRPVFGEGDALGLFLGDPLRGRGPFLALDGAPLIGQPTFGIGLGGVGLGRFVAH